MDKKIDLNSFIEANEKILSNYQRIKTKSEDFSCDVKTSFDSKKDRFNQKRTQRNKEFNFLRNK